MTPASTRGGELKSRLAELDRLAEDRGILLVTDAPLGPMTTLRVGGSADRMLVADDIDALIAGLGLASDAGVLAGVIGKGSDIVVADAGIRGLVIRNRADAIHIDGRAIVAGSGTAMAALVKRCAAAGLAGLEFGISIPGSVGGAVWANAGAHEGEMQDVVREVHAWSAHEGRDVRLTNEDCEFAYRDSRFKSGSEVILAATLVLEPGDRELIRQQVAAHQERRRATQPLADQNAGSVFRNPEGDHAGRLIESAGLKGRRIGSASVSTLHANFIVVDRGGRASDVRMIGEMVRRTVADRFGIDLQYEIEFVGDWPADELADPSALAGIS
ncbi:MAG: UDP-N-acetylmuramate dehydrogenase [Candidatus Limnocylindria bacterium]